MTHRPFLCLAAAVLALPGPAAALTLDFGGEARQTGARVERMTSYLMPVGPFAGEEIATLRVEGALDQRSWTVAAPGLSTLEMLVPLRDQLTRAGFDVIYECEAVACGGFDFRYGTDVLPEPDMHVDLGDFRYLAARRQGAEGLEVVNLIISRAGDTGFVQVTRVGHSVTSPPPSDDGPDTSAAPPGGPAATDPAIADPATAPGPAMPPDPVVMPVPDPVPGQGTGTLAERLTTGGAQVLADLVFASGAAALSQGAYGSLAELAAFLQANPQARVMLVGHTDASGALGANIALSRERARSVRQRLLTEFDIPARQVEAEGVGYLVPRAPNDTEAGRLANRRVEVMLLEPGG